jgi:hypothetical protein
VVVFAGEQRPGFKLGDVDIGRGELAVQFPQQVILLFRVGFFLRQMYVGLDIAADGGEFLVSGNLFLGAFPFAENALRSFLIIPKIGFGDARFEGFQPLTVLRCVKDSSARDGCAA